MRSMANSFTFENYVLFAFLLFAHDDNRSLYAYKGFKTGEVLWCWRLICQITRYFPHTPFQNDRFYRLI